MRSSHGRCAPRAQVISQYEEAEASRDSELSKLRLLNLQRKSHKDRLEQYLRQRERLAEGLHLCVPPAPGAVWPRLTWALHAPSQHRL